MEQDKIDVTRATPVADIAGAPATAPLQRRGAPIWLQLLLSLIVIVGALGAAALVNGTANSLLANVGLKLPMLTASADPAAPATGPAAGPGGAPRQGGGQGAGGAPGGRGANRTAVVVAQPAVTGTINNALTAIGEGSAIQSVTISSASGGTLVSVDVKPGDKVAAGARLATLDSGTQQNAYDRARLAAEDADATLARTQTLAKSSSVSAAALATAQLAADQARIALNDAKLNLDQRTITTPVSGTVGLLKVTPGNLINAQTVVTTVEDSSQILVNFWVAERYSSQIAVGAAVAATSSALPGKTFTGVVSAVDNKIDPASRTLQVQATLPNPDGSIKSGMSFTVDMTFPGETFPSVDPLSIQWSNQGAYVWKIVDGKVKKGMVEIIQRNTDGVLVKGDVQPGDSVVTQGVLQLADNAPVRLLDQGQGNAAATPASGGADASPAPAAQTPPTGGGKRKGSGQGGQSSSQAPTTATGG